MLISLSVFKTQTARSVGEAVEKMEPSYTAAGRMENNMDVSQIDV
jgi:hypothetical protein